MRGESRRTWLDMMWSSMLIALLAACGSSSETSLLITVKLAEQISIDELVIRLQPNNPEDVTLEKRVSTTATGIADGTTVLAKVPERWDGQEVTVEINGLRAGQKTLAGSAKVLARRGERVPVTVTLASPCPTGCIAGTSECVDDKMRRCEGDTDGCGKWGEPSSCGDNEVCSRGSCVSSCDGKPCTCEAGETQDCADVGECKGGTRECVDGAFGECKWQTGPKAEVCGDSKDNDCDSQVDEGCKAEGCTDAPAVPIENPAASCTAGQKTWCEGLVSSRWGVATCKSDGKWPTKVINGKTLLDCAEPTEILRPDNTCACYHHYFNAACCECSNCLWPPGATGKVCPASGGKLCDPCTVAGSACTESGARCIMTATHEAFCGRACQLGVSGTCPTGYKCVDATFGTEKSSQCVPEDFSCL